MDFGSIRDSCLIEQMACSSVLQEIVSCVPKLVVLNRTSRVTLLLKLQSSNIHYWKWFHEIDLEADDAVYCHDSHVV